MLWLRRLLPVFCIALVVIVSAHLLQGHELIFSLSQTLFWAVTVRLLLPPRVFTKPTQVFIAHCAMKLQTYIAADGLPTTPV